MDKDIRRGRPGQVDAGEGMQPRQREARGLLRKIEDRILPRLRLGRGHDREVHGDARRLSQMVQGCQDEGRPGLQEPHAVPQGLGSAGGVGWIRSRILTAVPSGHFLLKENKERGVRDAGAARGHDLGVRRRIQHDEAPPVAGLLTPSTWYFSGIAEAA